MSNTVKKGNKNASSKSKLQNNYSIKFKASKEEDQKPKDSTSFPKLSEEEIQEINKQNKLLEQIKEYEEKLKSEKQQRKYLIEAKENEIEIKQNTIKKMTETNQKLQFELEKIQSKVQEKMDKIEKKEKNDKNEIDKKKDESSLKQLLKVKEKELDNSNMAVEKYRKEREELRKKLDITININEINYLNDQIKIAQDKIKELEDEKIYLIKIKDEHLQC